MMPVIDPISADVWICWCGNLHTSERSAGQCAHRPPVPFVPGHAESESMRNAIPIPYPKSHSCPGPRYCAICPRPAPARKSTTLRDAVLCVVLVFACSAAIWGGVLWATTPPGPRAPAPAPAAPVTTPTTYGPPGPNGGPR